MEDTEDKCYCTENDEKCTSLDLQSVNEHKILISRLLAVNKRSSGSRSDRRSCSTLQRKFNTDDQNE